MQENAPGALVTTVVAAVDPDAGDVLTYSLSSNPDGLVRGFASAVRHSFSIHHADSLHTLLSLPRVVGAGACPASPLSRSPAPVQFTLVGLSLYLAPATSFNYEVLPNDYVRPCSCWHVGRACICCALVLPVP